MNPCGLYSVCRSYDKQPVCSCQPGYVGLPPNCRPECTLNADCIGTRVCVNNRCTNPCPGSCAPQALCSVANHIPLCTCPEGYTGDPFVMCSLILPRKVHTFIASLTFIKKNKNTFVYNLSLIPFYKKYFKV